MRFFSFVIFEVIILLKKKSKFMFNLLLFENIDFLNYLDFRCLRAALLYN